MGSALVKLGSMKSRAARRKCDECGEVSLNFVRCVACGCMVCCADENGIGSTCRLEIEMGVISTVHERPSTRTD
jgi:hypothetical protein